ncbi:MAG: ATPase [Steroidobacteraceae bacterium]
MAEDGTLKRLLEAESKAEEIIASADRQRVASIEQARQAAQAAQTESAQHLAEIAASFMAQAEQRAGQTIAELKRRHAERLQAMKAAAELARAQALEAALAVLIGISKNPP